MLSAGSRREASRTISTRSVCLIMRTGILCTLFSDDLYIRVYLSLVLSHSASHGCDRAIDQAARCSLLIINNPSSRSRASSGSLVTFHPPSSWAQHEGLRDCRGITRRRWKRRVLLTAYNKMTELGDCRGNTCSNESGLSADLAQRQQSVSMRKSYPVHSLAASVRPRLGVLFTAGGRIF